jgi:hypothetical protein
VGGGIVVLLAEEHQVVRGDGIGKLREAHEAFGPRVVHAQGGRGVGGREGGASARGAGGGEEGDRADQQLPDGT